MTKNVESLLTPLNEGKVRSYVIVARRFLDSAILFLPSCFLVFLGILAFTNPALLGALVAAVFLFVGFVFAYLTWRAVQWKKKIEAAFKNFGGQFVVQGYAVPKQEDVVRLRKMADDKKIIIH